MVQSWWWQPSKLSTTSEFLITASYIWNSQTNKLSLGLFYHHKMVVKENRISWVFIIRHKRSKNLNDKPIDTIIVLAINRKKNLTGWSGLRWLLTVAQESFSAEIFLRLFTECVEGEETHHVDSHNSQSHICSLLGSRVSRIRLKISHESENQLRPHSHRWHDGVGSIQLWTPLFIPS